MSIKRLIMATAIVTAVTASTVLNAQTACTGTRISDTTALENLLDNQLVCAFKGADFSDPNQRWSENHLENGDVQEFGPGGNSTMQPPEVIGTWTVTGASPNAVVTYTYGSAGPYTYRVNDTSGNYQFCDDSNNLIATIKSIESLATDPATVNPCAW
jgi:hypothetical protein